MKREKGKGEATRDSREKGWEKAHADEWSDEETDKQQENNEETPLAVDQEGEDDSDSSEDEDAMR